MRQIAYSGAVGCGYLFGPGSAVSAAEWSLAPTYIAAVDYDSNRRYVLDAQGSESGLVSADLRFSRTTEDTDIYLEPRYAVRRYSQPLLGNADDRSLAVGFDRHNEATSLSLTASILDQSTLISELFETGITEANTRQRLIQLGGNWNWTQTERRLLISQFTYLDTSYSGAASAFLPGYRSPSGSLGERFVFSEVGSVTVSAYGSQLSSDVPGGSSHELGIEAELIYSFSDRTRFDGTLGESSRVLSGVSSRGTDINATLTHDLSSSLGNVSLGYTRNLVPYGNGFLVERRQITAAATRQLTEYLGVTVSYQRVDNDQRTVLLGIDRRKYDNLLGSLNWRVAETWSVGVQLSAARTVPLGFVPGTVHEWRSAIILTWTPPPLARSR